MVDVPVVCMYCKKTVGHKPMRAGRYSADASTSTICPVCLEKYHPDVAKELADDDTKKST
jgi:hypothetical protein